MTREYEQGTALIVGGTSGLGLELATLLLTKNNFEVFVTGRKEPEKLKLRFLCLDIGPHTDQFLHRIEKIISDLPQQIDLLTQLFEMSQHDKTTIFVDPVLGDSGELYPSREKLAKEMSSLVAQAHVITPNPTEAALLLKKTLKRLA